MAEPLQDQEIGRFLLSNQLRRTALIPDSRGREAGIDGSMRRGGGCGLMGEKHRRNVRLCYYLREILEVCLHTPSVRGVWLGANEVEEGY